MPNILLNLFFILILTLTSYNCVAADTQETRVQYIPLAAPLDRAKAQISGMTWCGDMLLILPERPWFEIAEDDPDPKSALVTYIYQLSRAQIDDYLSNKQSKALVASRIKLQENGVRDRLKYFDGYEAIACSGNKIWLSIETQLGEKVYETNIVTAKLSGAGDQWSIDIDPSTLHQIESQSGIDNYSDEALLFEDNALISIHEANSTHREIPSFATRIDNLTGKQTRLPFPAISFRITDVTALDNDGYFWGMNYAWSGECHWFTQTDDLADKYGLGETHKLEKNVERLIQFRLHKDRIERVEQAPIQLELTQEDGRNWEGIVRYRDQGMLLITDQHPRTLLGFVPFDQ